MADNKKVVLKYRISGGYYLPGKDGSEHHDYPEPFKEATLPANVADALLASNQAWTPSEFKKVSEQE